jgi:hypothetical protein
MPANDGCALILGRRSRVWTPVAVKDVVDGRVVANAEFERRSRGRRIERIEKDRGVDGVILGWVRSGREPIGRSVYFWAWRGSNCLAAVDLGHRDGRNEERMQRVHSIVDCWP